MQPPALKLAIREAKKEKAESSITVCIQTPGLSDRWALRRASRNQEEPTNPGEGHLQRGGRMVKPAVLSPPLAHTVALFSLHFPPESLPGSPLYVSERVSKAASSDFSGAEEETARFLAPCRAPLPALPLSRFFFPSRHAITRNHDGTENIIQPINAPPQPMRSRYGLATDYNNPTAH